MRSREVTGCVSHMAGSGISNLWMLSRTFAALCVCIFFARNVRFCFRGFRPVFEGLVALLRSSKFCNWSFLIVPFYVRLLCRDRRTIRKSFTTLSSLLTTMYVIPVVMRVMVQV